MLAASGCDGFTDYMRMHPTAPGAHPWTIGLAARRAREVLRDEGVWPLWLKAVGEVCYRRLLVLEFDLRQPLPPVSTDIPIAIGALECDEDYETLRPDLPGGEAARLRAASGRCYVARVAGQVVSATWTFRDRAPVPYLSMELSGGPNAESLYSSWTRPEYRGRGISPALVNAIARDAGAQGCERLLTAILPENRPSMRARLKFGFRAVAVMGSVRVGPVRLAFRRPALIRRRYVA